DEHFRRTGHRRNSGSDMDGDPAQSVACELDLSGVATRSDLDPQRTYRPSDGHRAPNGASRSVEPCEDTVAGRVHPGSTSALDLRLRQLVVSRQQVLPRLVSDPRNVLGRTDDVGEEDGGKHAGWLWGWAHAGQ